MTASARAQFKDKRVLVTGASRGIGRELAKSLVEEGAVVAISGRRRKTLEETRGRTGDPRRVHICPGDFRAHAGVAALAAAAQKRLRGGAHARERAGRPPPGGAARGA